MGERATVDPNIVRAAEFKRRDVTLKNEELMLAVDQIVPYFPRGYTGDGKREQYGSFWVNPEEAKDPNIPAIIISGRTIRKTFDRSQAGPELRDLKQLSHMEYVRYFDSGLDLLKQFAEIEKLRRKSQLTAQELKNLTHLIYRTAGGDEEYDENSMEFAGRGAATMHMTLSEPDRNFGAVVFYNGLPEYAGEELSLVEKEDTGELAWKIGTYESFYSPTLGKYFDMDKRIGDPILSKENLNQEEMAILGRKITDTYIRLRSQGFMPTFFC